MGLDGIELLLAVEDKFQIQISNDEASGVSTVGDLNSLLMSKLQGQNLKRCLTSSAFYRTRRGIVDALGLNRREVRPSTRLEIILPRGNRREKWRDLQRAMELNLPDLQHPVWIWTTLYVTGLALTVVPAVYSKLEFPWIALLSVVGFCTGGLFVMLTPTLAFAFPNRDATVGDLAKDVLAANYAQMAAEVGGWNRNDIWETLCRVIVMQTGVPREKIRPEATFVDDLRID